MPCGATSAEALLEAGERALLLRVQQPVGVLLDDVGGRTEVDAGVGCREVGDHGSEGRRERLDERRDVALGAVRALGSRRG